MNKETIVDKLINTMSIETLFSELMRSLNADEAKDHLLYIARMHNIDVEEKEEQDEEEEFIVHGHYAWSNCCGYEVQLSDCGDAARLRMNKWTENEVVTDWLEIQSVIDADGACDEEGFPDFHQVIDPDGWDVPLNLVMRCEN